MACKRSLRSSSRDKTDRYGQKTPIFVFIFFKENRTWFEKIRIGNGMGIYGHTEIDKYG
jgi:hypothetical protein